MSRSSKSSFRGGGYSSSGPISELPKMPESLGPGSSSHPRDNWFRFEILAVCHRDKSPDWENGISISVISTDIKNAIEKAKSALDISEYASDWVLLLQSVQELQ